MLKMLREYGFLIIFAKIIYRWLPLIQVWLTAAPTKTISKKELGFGGVKTCLNQKSLTSNI